MPLTVLSVYPVLLHAAAMHTLFCRYWVPVQIDPAHAATTEVRYFASRTMGRTGGGGQGRRPQHHRSRTEHGRRKRHDRGLREGGRAGTCGKCALVAPSRRESRFARQVVTCKFQRWANPPGLIHSARRRSRHEVRANQAVRHAIGGRWRACDVHLGGSPPHKH